MLGSAFRSLRLPREDIVVATKLWASGEGPNRAGLSAKRVREGVAACLRRLGYARTRDRETRRIAKDRVE
eukprot:gene6848-biopygen9374